MEKTAKVIRSMSLGQLAELYGISTKTLRTRLKRQGVDFNGDRVLLPAQLKRVIEALGHWELADED